MKKLLILAALFTVWIHGCKGQSPASVSADGYEPKYGDRVVVQEGFWGDKHGTAVDEVELSRGTEYLIKFDGPYHTEFFPAANLRLEGILENYQHKRLPGSPRVAPSSCKTCHTERELTEFEWAAIKQKYGVK